MQQHNQRSMHNSQWTNNSHLSHGHHHWAVKHRSAWKTKVLPQCNCRIRTGSDSKVPNQPRQLDWSVFGHHHRSYARPLCHRHCGLWLPTIHRWTGRTNDVAAPFRCIVHYQAPPIKNQNGTKNCCRRTAPHWPLNLPSNQIAPMLVQRKKRAKRKSGIENVSPVRHVWRLLNHSRSTAHTVEWSSSCSLDESLKHDSRSNFNLMIVHRVILLTAFWLIKAIFPVIRV